MFSEKIPMTIQRNFCKLEKLKNSHLKYSPPNHIKKGAKILVAMSGGIDSTITAYLLKKAGFDCIGIYMQYWTDPKYVPKENEIEITNKCCNLEDLNNAKAFAHKLEIPFYTLNFREEFKKAIVDEFIETFALMQTPNPCVTCNKKIKFGVLKNKMHELGADYIATGHYARIIQAPEGPGRFSKPARSKFELYEGVDKTKDQSYFLHQLDQETLSHIILPLGDFTKEEVKNFAKEIGLKTLSSKKESQGVCFYPDKNYVDFLRRYLPEKYFDKGEIVDLEGNVLGEHNGLINYTIGQRKGVLVGGQEKPIYVIGFNLEKNQLILGPDEALWKEEIKLKNIHWINEELPKQDVKLEVRIRHLAKKETAVFKVPLACGEKGVQGVLQLEKPLRAITPGQFAVFYDGEKVLGGGTIM